MDNKEVPEWASGCVKKHGIDALRVMLDLIEMGLKIGEVSANDIRLETRRSFVQPNVIGAIMKIAMKRIGFQQKTIKSGFRTYFMMEKSLLDNQHSRLLSVWNLVDAGKATQVKKDLLYALTGHEEDPYDRLLI